MGNVVADTTAHVQKLAKATPNVLLTPAQYAAAVGYPGSKASALRAHIARQHGQGAQRTGHGRYPAVTPAQMLVLLGAGHAVRKPDATAQVRKASTAKVAKVLWPKAPAKRQRKAKAKAEPTAQATPQAQAEPTAQAQG